MRNSLKNVSYEALEPVLGDSNGFIIATNSCFKLEKVNIYQFNRETLHKGDILRSMLFGRVANPDIFKAVAYTCNWLAQHNKPIYEDVPVKELEAFDPNNFGKAVELYLKAHKFKPTTNFQDKVLKQDVKLGRWYYQVKTSIATEATGWSFGTSNGRIAGDF